ncbi:MAG: hypothetical protein HY315_00940 [Acidobacteria bacterium]|nr:hypothetical protein [Acidobacteriota bacterium]
MNLTSELLLDLFVRDETPRLRLTKTFFNLRNETEPLDGILNRGIVGKGT